MYASMHGVAKSAFSVTFGDNEVVAEVDCVHLDKKHFVPNRLSQKICKDISCTPDCDDENKVGMGVWCSRSPEWNAKRSPAFTFTEGSADILCNMPELQLDSAPIESKICYMRSRSASTGVEKHTIRKSSSESLHVSNLLFKGVLDDRGSPTEQGEESQRSSPFSSPTISKRLSASSSPKFDQIKDDQSSNRTRDDTFAVDFLPPTWDPQSPFCFPMAQVPVARLVPDNMELRHFTNIVHIADGSNANVFYAGLDGEQVIIKMIREEVQTDRVAVHEFDVEHGILVRVSHPNIIKILGAGRNPRRFVVLEFLAGGTLSSLLSSNLAKPGLTARLFHRSTFGFFNLLAKARELACAMDYMHRKIVKGATIMHRDLKPDNVGFAKDGSLKLFDFGLCTCVREREESCSGYDMTGNTGSLRYMAPEVALRQIYSEKVDVYSFGIMLWQMAADKVPFKGLTRDAFMRRVVIEGERPKLGMMWPSRLVSLLKSCWSANAKERPSFESIVQQLDKMMT